MRYSVKIQKFLYSQYFFGGLRIALGISLPVVLCLLVFGNRELGFTIAIGALGASVVDMPGPLKHKHNEMLACTVIGSLAVLAAGLATFNVLALWVAIVPLTFALSLTVVYGNHWPLISFSSLFMMALVLQNNFTPQQALVNTGWVLTGGLWYTYWSTLVSHWQAYRIEKQALAEGIFACANFLLTRANFYSLDTDLDDNYRQLVEKQIATIEMQNTARDIVLRNSSKLEKGKLNQRRVKLFNLFINSVDLHDLFVGAHTDYALLRETFGNSDLMIFYHDLLNKTALDLEQIGLAVLQNRAPSVHISGKAELRAIEFELDLLRKRGFAAQNPAAYAGAMATFRRLWSASRLISKMRKTLSDHSGPLQTEIRIDETLTRFLSNRRVPFGQIFSNLTLASPSFRHALRVTIAVSAAFWFGRLLPITNAYWIVMTTLIILKPDYSLTKQRNRQRLIGTAIGCAASIALLLSVKSPVVLLVCMFASMVMGYSLLLSNYTASVVFTSAFVLLLFDLLAPGDMRLIGERAIDTIIGCTIAVAASRLFPYWEYRALGKRIKEMIAAMRQYLEASWWMSKKKPLSDGETLPTIPSADQDVDYRLARKAVHIAFANLGQSFKRMMLEPKAQQKFIGEINDMLMQSHVLASQITAATPLLRNASQQHEQSWQVLQRVLSAIRDNLAQAQEDAPPTDTSDLNRQLIQDLDAMTAEIEHSAAAESAQEIKLLAHQCKQMLSASTLIRKDASMISLPVV